MMTFLYAFNSLHCVLIKCAKKYSQQINAVLNEIPYAGTKSLTRVFR